MFKNALLLALFTSLIAISAPKVKVIDLSWSNPTITFLEKHLAEMEKAGFTVSKSEHVDAPVINELGMCLECELISYDVKTGCLVGNIVNVCADEAVLTDGKIDAEKLGPVTYDPEAHTYRKLGAVVGTAFSDGKKLF